MATIRTMPHSGAIATSQDADRPMSMRGAMFFWLIASLAGWSLIFRLI